MIQDFFAQGIKPSACLVGEPTSMHPIVAHKGKSTFLCKFHGQAAHSSLTSKGCNTIEHAADLCLFLRQIANSYALHGPFDPHFDLPYTSLSSNLIHGGNAENTIPAYCELLFEFRNLPKDDANAINQKISSYINDELLSKMHTESPSAKIHMATLSSIPAFEASEDSLFTQLIRRITGEPKLLKVSYGTEAGQFQQEGIPTLVCGPGSIEQAHRPDEYVSLEQLEKCKAFLSTLVTSFDRDRA